jgi:diguanylate cyclase (GGDEF)-like protein/PAS domain S-box-containing protein
VITGLPAAGTDATPPGREPAEAILAGRLLRASRWCALVATAVGALVLVGWQFDLGTLKSIRPELGAMAPNTALGFVLLGVTLWRMQRAGDGRDALASVLAGAAMLLSGLTLAEYLSGQDLGIDELLFADPARAVQTAHPGRMSLVASLQFLLLGLALLLVGTKTRAAQRVAWALALGTAVMSLLGLLGFLYGRASLYALPLFTGVALHALLTFVVLAAGVLAVQPARGFTTILTSAGEGGKLARRLLPVATLVPLALGWLRLEGERAGLYPAAMGVELMVVAMVVLFTVLISWNAALLQKAWTDRARAEAALRLSEQQVRLRLAEIEQIYRYAPVGLFIFDRECRFQRINERMAEINGLSPEAHAGKSMWEVIPDLAGQLQELYRPVFERGEPVLDVEIHGRTPRDPDTVHDWLASYFPLKSETGEVVGLIGAVLDISERKHAEEALRASEAEVRRLALTDPLTGVGNRRRLDEALRTEISRMHRYDGRLSAVMTDLDHFKRINDRHGHQVGDQVLQEFARLLQSHCRDIDLVARFGGEEFVILMPEVGLDEARACAERMRATLAQATIPPLAEPVTASFGVAELAPGEDGEALLRRADEALYAGKAAGRDRVTVAAGAAK